MNKIKQILRLFHVLYVLARYNIDQLIFSLPIFTSLRFFSYFNPWYWFNHKKQSQGVQLRLALEKLGPIFIKFGQMLSTRRDLLPEDIADELAKLQDNVPGFSGIKAQAILEKNYQKPLSELFIHFEIIPLASASIAQVHAAQLITGEQVVVKILRPGIEKLIHRDISLLYFLAKIMAYYWKASLRLKPIEIVKEFELTLIDELDLLREAANASQLRRNFLNSPIIYVPKIYWDYAHHNAIVMERINGIPLGNIAALQKQGVNLKILAERGVEIFFTQVFRDCFFHADMHPGNIFVNASDPENPQYAAVDFGIMGTLSPQDQRYLAENLVAFFKRDYRRVAELHIASGWIPIDTRIDQFEAAIRTVCEPIFEKPLKEISFGQLLLRLFQTASRFNMEIQPQLILLQKTLLNIEGLGRQLYPDLDLWKTAKPLLEHWMRKQIGFGAMLRKIKNYAPYWAEKLPELPDAFFEIIQHRKQILLKKEQGTLKPNKNSHPFILLSLGFISGMVSLLVFLLLRY
ncbi:MAG: putative protein kinase UbiB [Legionellaceae bacterium]